MRRFAAPALLLALAWPVGCRSPLPAASERWLELRSPRFVAITDAPLAEGALALRELERFQALVEALLPGRRRDLGVPLEVVVFRDPRSFRRYHSRRRAVGAFVPAPYAAYLLVSRNAAGADTRETLHHEYVHALLWRSNAALPLWFEEGLAELLSTAVLFPGHADFGLVPLGRMRALESGLPWLPTARLLEVSHGSPEYASQPWTAAFYAQSWAMLHYLRFQRPDGWAQLRRYLALRLEGGTPGRAAFHDAFGVAPERFDQELAAYLRAGRFRYRMIPFRDPLAPGEVTARELSRSEALLRLGRLSWAVSRGDASRADAHFAGALAEAPELAQARVWLALARQQRGRFEEADALAQRGLAEAPESALLHSLYADVTLGRWLLRRPWDADWTERRRRRDLARVHYRRALELDPGLGEAHVGLGTSYRGDPEQAERGLRLLERSRALIPWRPDVELGVAEFAVALGDAGRAARALERVILSSDDPGSVERARRMLERIRPRVGAAP